MAAAVIHLFKTAIVKVVDLAMLMPVVASMGGIASTQTMTLVIRGQATGQLGRGNLLWMLNREFIVGALNGLTRATVVAVGAVYFFEDPQLGWVIAAAMFATILLAAGTGGLLPNLLRRMNTDPAIAGGVVLTTITEDEGVFILLGLAS